MRLELMTTLIILQVIKRESSPFIKVFSLDVICSETEYLKR